jgi:hypothetical protein
MADPDVHEMHLAQHPARVLYEPPPRPAFADHSQRLEDELLRVERSRVLRTSIYVPVLTYGGDAERFARRRRPKDV